MAALQTQLETVDGELRRFARATRQWGLDEAREGLDCAKFAVPDDGRPKITEAQMSLF